MQIDVARALPADDTDIEPARAFLQERIALWAFWVFVLSGGFFLINVAAFPLMLGPSVAMRRALLDAATLDHLAATVVFGGAWLLTRRGRLSRPVLRLLDAAVLLVGCLLFALMGAAIMRHVAGGLMDMAVGAYAGLLACANTILARTVAVPSTPRRTLALSVGAMAPLVPVTYSATGGSIAACIDITAWCAVSVSIATVGSRVIFGLRTEAARVRRLGQYTLEDKLGAGGMGVVYRARHAMLRRPTAIKLLPPDRAGEASVARFEREVQITAELSHPNTVAIYDYGRTPDGVFYYAMEYLDGINLEDLVRRSGPQPAGRVVAILDQVCGALAEAHERGLVHRDIKPANIILAERGGEPDVAKVVDFGLVKLVAADAASTTMTGGAMLTGTPLYMSPEAMMAPDAADTRSDLYALGAVAYWLLAGRPVFEAATVVEVIGHHLHTEPIPPSRRAGIVIPPALEAVVVDCLRKRPDDRPASARELRDRLRRTGATGWTQEDALAWWREFRTGATRRPPLPAPDAPTL